METNKNQLLGENHIKYLIDKDKEDDKLIGIEDK